MSNITFSQAKLKGEARQSVIQTVQAQLQEAALKAITPQLTGFLQAELQTKLGASL